MLIIFIYSFISNIGQCVSHLKSYLFDFGEQNLNSKKKIVNAELRQEAIHYYYHGKLSVSVIAKKLGKSTQTIYK